ncbi:hypothetical protein LuPra_01556 [Luteitalea pratensis]|uniref:Uncharacterized protein n=1 Tax=Luteitalea pratensis TaxID=1855912 RepID=A0A143PKT3_LUTPR|nr:hypothetical protein [Luteitalea pratensis]AMY08359.1 hypothetical protein LuPra_01556 [Luteitalea pratensis]
MLRHALDAITVTATVAVAATVGQAPAPGTEDFNRLTPDQLKASIEKQHPAAYYVLAGKLFASGEKDEAVFWFYAGQLRYRFHLAANPDLPPSGDAALFASLSEVLGRPINKYAFGDVVQVTATIDKVLAWDGRTANGYTSKTTHAAAWKGIRDGLGQLRSHLVQSGDQIRAQHKQNGLENRQP